jgi:hypothetical protein
MHSTRTATRETITSNRIVVSCGLQQHAFSLPLTQPLKADPLPVAAGCVIPMSKLTCSSMAVILKLPCSSSREMPAAQQQNGVSVWVKSPAIAWTCPHRWGLCYHTHCTHPVYRSQQAMPGARQTTASSRRRSQPSKTGSRQRPREPRDARRDAAPNQTASQFHRLAVATRAIGCPKKTSVRVHAPG